MANLKGAKICLETFDLKPNFSELGRMYGIDRRTAKKYYNGVTSKEERIKSSKLDKYIETIKEKLNIPGTNMKSVYKFIQMNIDSNIGTYSNFRKYIYKHKDLIVTKNTDAHVLFETDYGFQLQFDWKGPITLHLKDSKEIVFYIFSATLCASRLHIFVYSKFMTRDAVEKCLIKTFKYIGGVPKECLTDNMSSIINYSQKDFVPEFKTFSKDMGFTPKHCKIKAPFTKGKDESCNRFMNWLLPYDYELDKEEDLINLVETLTQEINKETNQTTNMPPAILFQKEKEYLQPLPNQIIMDNYLETLIPVKVQNTMLIYYKGSKYSVPKKYINQTLKVKEFDNKLFIYYNKNLVATHDISNKKINYRENDYVEGLSSRLNDKTQDQIEALAKHNLELLEKLTK